MDSVTARIFISYARRDGEKCATRIAADLRQRGAIVWIDLAEIRAGSKWTVEIEQAIDECDVFLALLSHGSYTSPICRAEQLRALRHGRRVLPIRLQQDAEVPLHLEGTQFIDFSNSDRLAELADLLQGDRTCRLSPAYKVTYVTAPSLPKGADSVPPALLAEVLSDATLTRMRIIAVRGRDHEQLRATAIALCHNPVVQSAFPDGVLWIESKLNESKALEQMRELGKALGDDLSRYDSVPGASHQFRSVVRKRAVLIVMHDAMDFDQVQTLVGDSPNSRLVFTTTELALAVKADAEHDLKGRPRRSRFLVLLASLGLVATLPGWVWEMCEGFYTSYDEKHRILEQQRFHAQDTIGWIVVLVAFILPLSILSLDRFRPVVRPGLRRRIAVSAAFGIGAILSMIYRDFRFVHAVNTGLPTVFYPLGVGFFYSAAAIWIAVRALETAR